MLSFVSIDFSDLIEGTKYKIEEATQCYFRTYIGIYNGTFNEFDYYDNVVPYLLWENTTFVAKNIKRVEFIRPKYFKMMRMESISSNDRQMYKLFCSKEKNQNAMELRAINLIIQNIIGDCAFTY